MNKSTKRFAIGTLVAALVGFLTGILTAPKSGKETRADIKKTAVDTKVETEKQLKKLHTELSVLLEQLSEKKDLYQGRAKTQYEDLNKKAVAVKQKARELLSAIHEGDAEDKDLKKVLAETSSAVNHLKAFLKK